MEKKNGKIIKKIRIKGRFMPDDSIMREKAHQIIIDCNSKVSRADGINIYGKSALKSPPTRPVLRD